jgi:hypothetical protein
MGTIRKGNHQSKWDSASLSLMLVFQSPPNNSPQPTTFRPVVKANKWKTVGIPGNGSQKWTVTAAQSAPARSQPRCGVGKRVSRGDFRRRGGGGSPLGGGQRRQGGQVAPWWAGRARGAGGVLGQGLTLVPTDGPAARLRGCRESRRRGRS